MKRQIKTYKRDDGFALFVVLIFFLILLLIAMGAAFINQMGFFSISAEAKYQIAEKRADKGLLVALESGNCSNYSEEGINVKAVKDEGYNYCFLWSEGTYKGAKVVKTSIFPLRASNWAAATYRNLNNFYGLGGNAAIIGYDSPENSCDDPNSCIAPALVTGNEVNPGEVVIACNTNPNNLGSGLVSTINPYVYDPNMGDLTSKFFNAGDRSELLSVLSSNFQVNFNNGTPAGLNGTEGVDKKTLDTVNSCSASSFQIICGTGSNKDIFTWDSTEKAYQYNKDGKYYSKVELPNASITFENFSGGGYVSINNVNFNGDVNPDRYLVLVARNQINMQTDKVTISNTFMFGKNYEITAKKLIVKNGIIYSGGAGNGNLNINLNAQTSLGTQDAPVLIISDNNINVQRNGNSEIWGVIYVTDANNNFSIGSGNGDFKIHGAVISNSLNNNNINLTGNFEIRFNYKEIERLYNYFNQLGFSIIRPPSCGASKKKLFTITTVRVY